MIPEDGNINQSAPFMVGGSQTNTTSNAFNNSQPTNNKKPKKSGSLMLIGVICLTIAAICGIAFGVWAMMDGNAKKDSLNQQITKLTKENSELTEQLNEIQQDIANSKDQQGKCTGTYYGELTSDKGGIKSELKYTYTLNDDGTFTADFSGTSGKEGTYIINGNTISLTGARELGGPAELVPAYITEDAIISDDCSYIKLENNGSYVFQLDRK